MTDKEKEITLRLDATITGYDELRAAFKEILDVCESSTYKDDSAGITDCISGIINDVCAAHDGKGKHKAASLPQP